MHDYTFIIFFRFFWRELETFKYLNFMIGFMNTECWNNSLKEK